MLLKWKSGRKIFYLYGSHCYVPVLLSWLIFQKYLLIIKVLLKMEEIHINEEASGRLTKTWKEPKWPETSQNKPKPAEMTQNQQRLPKILQNNSKQPKFSKLGKSGILYWLLFFKFRVQGQKTLTFLTWCTLFWMYWFWIFICFLKFQAQISKYWHFGPKCINFLILAKFCLISNLTFSFFSFFFFGISLYFGFTYLTKHKNDKL